MTKYCGSSPPAPDDLDERLDHLGDALASPRRRRVISRLAAGPATTSELADLAGTSLPTMHQHLDVLRRAALVESNKSGRTVTHTVDLAPLGALTDWISTRRSFWTHQLDELADAVER